MKKAVTLLFLFSIVWNIGAQRINVSSKVLDALTKEILPYATIHLNGEKSSIANRDGEFNVMALPDGELTITYVGYRPATIKAADIGNIIFLDSYATELPEVTVSVIDFKDFLGKVISSIKNELQNHLKTESNFYYRQTTLNGEECCEYIESFFNAFSDLSMRQPSVITGRYGALNNTDSTRYSIPGNIHTLSSISPYADKVYKDCIICPLVPKYNKYFTLDYEVLTDGTSNNTIYKILFKPLETEKKPIVDGALYIDIETSKILKYEGKVLNTQIAYPQGPRYNVNIDFSVVYSNQNDFTEVESVSIVTTYDDAGIPVTINSTLYNVGKKYFKGKKRFNDFSNLKEIINETGYNAGFWKMNSIFKRTPMEENVVEMFEKENVFSNMN